MMRVAVRKGPTFVRPIRRGTHSSYTAVAAGSGTHLLSSSPSLVVVREQDGPNQYYSRSQQRKARLSRASSSYSRSDHSHRSSGNSSSSSPRLLSANVLFAVVAVASLRPLMTMAEAKTATTNKHKQDDKNKNNRKEEILLQYATGHACPPYGCVLHPLDIVATPPQDPHHNGQHAAESLQVLADIRTQTRTTISQTHETSLDTTARKDMATLTMTGNKGGPASSQINQDRALAVGPYWIGIEPEVERKLIGVFDGHAARGEVVSDYVVKELPRLLAEKLRQALPSNTTTNDNKDNNKNNNQGPEDEEVSITKRVLQETFVDLDKTAPANPSGGCTASVVFLQGDNAYIANAGDSQSFVGVYRKSSNETKIVLISREDKPHLEDERQRVEAMGGYVYIPARGTSRVVYVNPRTGSQTGLAMSRSIGDQEFTKLGVIPDPIVDVVNIPELVAKELALSEARKSECWVVDDDGVVSRANKAEECVDWADLGKDVEDDVYVFAVSCTDGMLDYVSTEAMSHLVALSLFGDGAVHPATACEILVSTAAQGWEKYRQGRYRDDIAISVTALRVPTTGSGSSTSTGQAGQEASPAKDEL